MSYFYNQLPDIIFSKCDISLVPVTKNLFLFLTRSITIRLAKFLDTAGVEKLVSTLLLSTKILDDLAQYNEAGRDPVSTASPCRSFVFMVARGHHDAQRFSRGASLNILGESVGMRGGAAEVR